MIKISEDGNHHQDCNAPRLHAWACGRDGRAWSDDLRPCPACGSQRVTSVHFAGHGDVVDMQRSQTGIVITFEDGTTTTLGVLPQDVQ